MSTWLTRRVSNTMAPLSQRSSVAPMSRARMSVAPGGSNARLAAKQAELQALQHLRSESANLAHEMAQLGDRVDTLVAGGSSTYSCSCSRLLGHGELARRIPCDSDRARYVSPLTQRRSTPRATRPNKIPSRPMRGKCRTRLCVFPSSRVNRRSRCTMYAPTQRRCLAAATEEAPSHP